jgi:hypothetical protein
MLKKFVYISVSILIAFVYIAKASDVLKERILYRDQNIVIKTNQFGNGLEIYYKNKRIFHIENLADAVTLEHKLDLNGDGKIDILVISLPFCGSEGICLPDNLFVFLNKGKPKLLSIYGDLKFYNKYVKVTSLAYCSDEYLINAEEKVLERCEPPYTLKQTVIYKIDLQKQALFLDIKQTRKLILSFLQELGNYKYVFVFYTKEFFDRIPYFRYVDYDPKEIKNQNLKVVDLSLTSRHFGNYSGMDVISLLSLASVVDKRLMKKIFKDHVIFENRKAYREFKKKYRFIFVDLESVIYSKHYFEHSY